MFLKFFGGSPLSGPWKRVPSSRKKKIFLWFQLISNFYFTIQFYYNKEDVCKKKKTQSNLNSSRDFVRSFVWSLILSITEICWSPPKNKGAKLSELGEIGRFQTNVVKTLKFRPIFEIGIHFFPYKSKIGPGASRKGLLI